MVLPNVPITMGLGWDKTSSDVKIDVDSGCVIVGNADSEIVFYGKMLSNSGAIQLNSTQKNI